MKVEALKGPAFVFNNIVIVEEIEINADPEYAEEKPEEVAEEVEIQNISLTSMNAPKPTSK